MDNEVGKIVQSLHQWVDHHDAIKRAEEALWETLENYLNEEPEMVLSYVPGSMRTTFSVQLENISLGISWPEAGFQYIDIKYSIACDQKAWGYYRALFEPSGDLWDDIFVC